VRTSVVVPCYNEAQRLQIRCFSDFLQAAPDGLSLLFVNDGSRDDTPTILNRLVEESRGRASLLSLDRNRGKADAVRQGLLKGLEEGVTFVGYWDADLATPLSAILLFQDVLEREPGIDAVLGSRVRLLGKKVTRRPVRHYLGRVFATAVSLMLAMPVYDTQCGAKMFRRTPALEEALQRPFESRWIFDVELLGRLLAWYRRHTPDREPEAFYEFPLPQWRDVAGSRVGPRDFARAIGEVASLYLRELRHLPAPLPGSFRD